MRRLVWAAALIGPAIGSAFAGVARVEPPLFDVGGVASWYCDWAANGVPLPIDVFKTFGDWRPSVENLENDALDACAAFLDSSAYAFAAPGAGARTFRAFDRFGAGDGDWSPDAAARGEAGVGRCCHGAREKFRLGVFDLIFGNSTPVPEPPTRAMVLIGFAWIGLAAYVRAIRNRAENLSRCRL